VEICEYLCGMMWYKILFTFLISFVVQYLMIWACHRYGVFIDKVKKLPQKFHKISTPRCGGIGILIGSCTFLLFDKIGLFLILASIPVLIVGILEDFTRKILHYNLRLLLISTSSVLFILLFPEVLSRIHTPITNIPIIDSLPVGVISAIAILFMIIAITGVTNAINIIDGFNGLASGTSLIAFMFLGFMAYIVGDIELLKIIVFLFTATLGFFLWNFPRAKIFLGDGGAYLLGFTLATISLLLVCRNTAVSIWYPLIILGYPVWEVLFSIYRKALVRKKSPMQPDREFTYIC